MPTPKKPGSRSRLVTSRGSSPDQEARERLTLGVGAILNRGGADPGKRADHWLQKARELHEAALTLWTAEGLAYAKVRQLGPNSQRVTDIVNSTPSLRYPLTGFGRISMLLAGSAIENLLKGLIVAQAGSSAAVPGHHRLDDLAATAGLTLSPAERRYLELAREAIYSFGRFPAALKPEHTVTSMALPNTWRTVHHRLFTRLADALAARCSGPARP